jgi:two-component system C4-dicarboxylate transport response regulator DctD
MTARVLLVDDDAAVREALCQTLDLADLMPVVASSYIEAKDHIDPSFDGIVVTDIRMPGKDGFAQLEYAQSVDEELPVILLTGEADIPMAVTGISGGAFDFLEKPCAPARFISVVKKALRTRALVLENRRLRQQMQSGDAAARLLFGSSELAAELRERVRNVARTTAEVLIHGEAGTGTAKVAEVVHLLSGDANRPFEKSPAAAMTPEMLKSAFERKSGGTLFLDEVAALSAASQYVLLGILENTPPTRTIAGTYRDLAVEVHEGRFNPDLYYRLDVMNVRIPALHERTEDIPVIFRHYVSIACEQANLTEPQISADILSNLMLQEWPGNARSLMNAAMRFSLGMPDAVTVVKEELGLSEQMARVERSLLIAALQKHSGNASEVARSLKLPRKTFYDKLTRHGIRPENYR